MSSAASESSEELQDEFEEIDEEYVAPNIDPIFRVDLDELTKGPGILNQLGAESLTHLKKLASNVPTGKSLLKALVLSRIHQKCENYYVYIHHL